MALRYEFPYNRPCNWTYESGTCECRRCNPTVKNIPEISIGPTHDGNRSRAEAAGEETADHDGFDVLGYSDGDLEDGEADKEGLGSTVDFGEWCPDQRSCYCQIYDSRGLDSYRMRSLGRID